MVLNPDASSCIGTLGGKPVGMQSDVPGNPLRAEVLTLPAVGHPAFGNVGGGISLLAPTTGLLRALDLTVNEYQGGEDSYGAWDPATGQFRLGWPARTNDLSFLTGPVIGDVGGGPGEDVVGGTAYLDLQAFDDLGQPTSSAWPKLTSDWMVANPVLGSFGTDELDAGAHRVVVTATRAGNVFAYATTAGQCAPASWPRFHHDNANSGDYRRDAVAPGRPMDAALRDGRIALRAPGDDLLCGRAARYELRTADGGWETVANVAPAPAGAAQELALPAGAQGRVEVRAVDEQGNVGRAAALSARR
jgi:hypothetical protein